MRLSLRTLLAFEDNVFDVEQHRRLEQLLPTDQSAEATLQRMRSVVRNPMLGVPGLVDKEEELDPNYVAEYLDHQMPGGVQEKFETYCLSADKYLAEVASIHHVLSNVLGEPARTSRECRLKCYEVLSVKDEGAETPGVLSEPSKHFRPYGLQESAPAKWTPFWQRWFPAKPAPQTPAAPTGQTSTSPVWTFCLIGLCICVLGLGWQQIEAKRAAQKLREISETHVSLDSTDAESLSDKSILDKSIFDPHVAENSVATAADATVGSVGHVDTLVTHQWESGSDLPHSLPPQTWTPQTATPLLPFAPPAPIEQVAHTSEMAASETVASETVPIVNPFVSVGDIPVPLAAKTLTAGEPDTKNESLPLPVTALPQLNVPGSVTTEALPPLSDDTIIEFQPVSSAEESSEVPQNLPPQETTQEPGEELELPEPVSARPALSEHSPSHSLPQPVMPQPVVQPILAQTIMQTSGTVPRVLGRVLPMIQPSVIFSAESSETPWQLLPLPFDLSAGQYLLTAAPFRGTFDLGGHFRIEMIGDAKLCILPPDASGVSGIFVDYGRIIIHPLQANQPLRIEMDRARGIVSVAGTESILFIDTFAEIADLPGRARLPEEHRLRASPILGFVPQNREQIFWQSAGQPQPFLVNTQGSVLLQSDQYRFGEIQNLPNWLLGPMSMSPEDRLLAETCRRYFDEVGREETDTGKIGAKALMRLAQDESQAVRILGLRLWGDLGEFFVPLTVMSERQAGDEATRRVLARYFDEVMRRDAESVQRFSDAIEEVKEAQRRTESVH